MTGSLAASKKYIAEHGLPKSEDEFNGHKFVAYKGKHVPHGINNWLLERIDPDQIVMRC